MTFEEALQLIEVILETKTGKQLALPEKEILKAAWENETYSSVADSLYLSVGHIKDLAALLWQRISDVVGEKVTKNNFRNLVEEQSISPTLAFKNIEEYYQNQNSDFKGNILIVDDLIENLRFLIQMLTKQGYKVRSVPNGKMVLRTISNNPPDIILLDIKMPEMDGYEVCSALKSNEETLDIPVIFLSALDGISDKVKAFQVGGGDYITKPFEPEEVLARIQAQITIQNQKQHLREEIARHQQTVELLQQSRAFLASVLNNSEDGIVAMQAVRDVTSGEIEDFCCLVLNSAITKLFGKKREDIMGKSVQKTLFSQIEPKLFDLLVQVVEIGIPLKQKLYRENDDVQEWYYFIAVKLGDGCSVTVRRLQKLSSFNY